MTNFAKTYACDQKQISVNLDFKALAALFTSVITWGSAFAGIRFALQDYSPGEIACLRYVVASLVFLALAFSKKIALPRKKDLPGLAILGFLGFTVYNLALGYGQQWVMAGTASFIISTGPVWMVLTGGLLFKEKLTLKSWVGVALALTGCVIIALGQNSGFSLGLGALAIFGASLASSGYSLGQKYFTRQYGSLALTSYAVWFGTLFLLPFAKDLVNTVACASWQSTFAVVYMGLIPGALGYLTWTYALSRLPASVAGMFLYLIPVAAIVIAWLWLGEIPSMGSILGGLIIITGLYITSRKKR